MSLPSPNLDDRNFYQLLEEAKARIVQSCPEWRTDLSPSDPGIVLLELFAHLTEVMIHRLNRLPEKAYIEFLRLMGVTIHPPSAARVELNFSLGRAADRPVEIPRGTRVTVARVNGGTELPVFVTSRAVTIDAGNTDINVLAYHCELIDAELAGISTGLPGQSVSARRPPIIAPTSDGLGLIVGVEAAPGELGGRARAVQHNDKAYRIWSEVESFTNLGPDRFIYIVDRTTGTITFAPAVQMKGRDGQLNPSPEALAEVPAAGREIRLWYRRGGGAEGNVAANMLTTLKDPIPGVQVNNPRPATGGRSAESLQNALARGPQELHSLERAVTASDFELVAKKSGAVARAKAFTKAALWVHAAPGTVEVLLVPYLTEEMRDGGQITVARLKEQETEDARLQIQKALDERRPLGTTCLVDWVHYKTVRVQARVVVHLGEDPEAVKARVVERLHQTINPLPTRTNPIGWRFGQPLRASDVYDIVLSEPGVSYADRIRLLIDRVPEKYVVSLTADAFQPRTWYAGSEQTLYRSLDDGDGWEPVGLFEDEKVELARVHPRKAGLLAVATRLPGEKGGARIYVSGDCGETWRLAAQTAFNVEDIVWTFREGIPLLLLATDVGLFELAMQPGASPVQVLVNPAKQDLGFYAITTTVGIRGTAYVALAARSNGGVFLSKQGGKGGTFSNIGLKGENVSILATQQEGVRSFLWAGTSIAGNEAGRGCFRWEMIGEGDPPEGWQQFQKNWTGGSCRSLAFQGSKVLAATHHAGVVWLDSSRSDAAWHAPVVGCGLPMRDVERIFYPVDAIAVDPNNRLIMAGGREGVYRSSDGGIKYEFSSSSEFLEKVTLPSTWLFCSGEHEIDVVSEDEAQRD
jgi:hypothetical protein